MQLKQFLKSKLTQMLLLICAFMMPTLTTIWPPLWVGIGIIKTQISGGTPMQSVFRLKPSQIFNLHLEQILY